MIPPIESLGRQFDNEVEALAALEAERARLEAQRKFKEEERFKQLYAEMKFGSMDEFILRLADFASPALRAKLKREGGEAVRRGRGRLTDEQKAQIASALRAGEGGTAVAARFGVSLPYVQGVKKQLGLVKPRAAKS
ncbi:MAG: hypothetical protein HZA31_05500 [Opitutae bacterium]|nr:hypothetical protein [Opitutae bacterium]